MEKKAESVGLTENLHVGSLENPHTEHKTKTRRTRDREAARLSGSNTRGTEVWRAGMEEQPRMGREMPENIPESMHNTGPQMPGGQWAPRRRDTTAAVPPTPW